LGIVYSPERRYDLNESLDSQIAGGVEWFHDVVIPAKLTLGLSYAPSNNLTWVGDVDFYSEVVNAMYVGGSELDTNDAIDQSQKVVIHGGFEYYALKSKNLDFIWRGGGYQEPPRLTFARSRFHYTMGVEIRWGFITVAAAYDQAGDFSTTAQSVGISFSAIN